MLGRRLEMHLWHDIIWRFFHQNNLAEITQTIEQKICIHLSLFTF